MLKRAVFIDTSALYAIFAPKDNLKQLCNEIFEEIISKYSVNLYTTTFVIYETLSKLKKFGLDQCKKLQVLIDNNIINVFPVDETLETKGLILFWNYEDKTWGVVDCISIEFMKEYQINYVFGLDEHFEQAGLYPLIRLKKGKPIKNYSTIDFVY